MKKELDTRWSKYNGSDEIFQRFTFSDHQDKALSLWSGKVKPRQISSDPLGIIYIYERDMKKSL